MTAESRNIKPENTETDPFIDPYGFKPYYYLWYNPDTKTLPYRITLKKAIDYQNAFKNIGDVSRNFPVDNDGKGQFTLLSDMETISPELAGEFLFRLKEFCKFEKIYTRWLSLSEYLNLRPREQKYYSHYMQVLYLNFPKGLPEGTEEEFCKLLKEKEQEKLQREKQQEEELQKKPQKPMFPKTKRMLKLSKLD